jgi:hypothetical protein
MEALMDRSKFIAGLAGPVALTLGVSMFLNRDLFPDIVHQIQTSYPLIIIAGAIALTAGLAVVQTHRTWSGWPALITALGWLLVIGGALRVMLPRQMADIAGQIGPDPAFLSVGALLLSAIGAFLTYKAYS